MISVEKEITGEDQFTDVFVPPSNPQHPKMGNCTLSITGSGWDASVILQRSFDKGETWHDVETFTENEQVNLFDATIGIYYRAGVKSGNFTDGPLTIKLAK